MRNRFSKLSVIVLLLLSVLIVACGKKPPETPPAGDDKSGQQAKGEILLSTTTSTDDSGLLGFILPEFTKDTVSPDTNIKSDTTRETIRLDPEFLLKNSIF